MTTTMTSAATRGWVMRATTVVARAFASSSRLARAIGDATAEDDERPWRRRAAHHASTPARASWSTTSMTAGRTADDEDEDASVLAPGELARVARLVGLNLEAMDDARESFARDVEEVVRLGGRLDAATSACGGEDARPMWTTRETNEGGGGDGLRMRFDAAARVYGEAGERETASAERGRLLGEAAFGTESFRYVAPRSAIEE
jgi:hypothetical protein